MISVPAGMRVLVATKPVDFRRGADGLVALVRETLGQDPFAGHQGKLCSNRVAAIVTLSGSTGVRAENWQIGARLDWRKSTSKRAAEPDDVYRAVREGAWTKVSLETQAPAEASSVALKLYLSNAPMGTVWWDDISLEQIAPPPPRKVTVASVNYIPVGARSGEESVRQFLSVADRAVGAAADVILRW